MPVDLSKVEAEAPHLVDLYKRAGVILEKSGIDPSVYKAAVLATFDHSGSASSLYSDGTMQRVADLGFVTGLQFDDDGSVPASLFDNVVNGLGEVELGNCRGFMKQHSRFGFGGTSYTAALRWIIDQAGYSHVNLGSLHGSQGGGGGLFRRKTTSESTGLSIKATAAYPAYALFVTDGEPQDPDRARELITLMSQLPIFVQFVGVGNHNFSFLRELDDLTGRVVDNVGFFDAKDVGNNQERMLELMLKEFPSYYREARKLGLVTG